MKIAIGLPTNRKVSPKTAESLMELVNSFKGKTEIIVSTRGYNCAENRNYIAAQAVKRECTHLFCVDDDMIYEPYTLENLLIHNRKIIGGLYETRHETQEYVIEYLNKDDDADEDVDKPFECKALGTGLLLIKTEVFKKIPQPWFGYLWHENGMVKESVDWFFCRKAREAGFKIYCTTDARAGHLKLKEF